MSARKNCHRRGPWLLFAAWALHDLEEGAAFSSTRDVSADRPGIDGLREAIDGATVRVIAARTHLAPGTVRNYASTAMAKLGIPAAARMTKYTTSAAMISQRQTSSNRSGKTTNSNSATAPT
ncbi:hypothetical protein [Luethyella okanaganae]|uniref:HTH luxR-type domain-containing protein n=1 Tax=Luethyella okanaganae TaxID=69372 RepID=A0ABW1VDM1_9MICO